MVPTTPEPVHLSHRGKGEKKKAGTKGNRGGGVGIRSGKRGKREGKCISGKGCQEKKLLFTATLQGNTK